MNFSEDPRKRQKRDEETEGEKEEAKEEKEGEKDGAKGPRGMKENYFHMSLMEIDQLLRLINSTLLGMLLFSLSLILFQCV